MNVVVGDFAGNQNQIMQALKPQILSAFGMDPNSEIVVRNVEEFGSADDFDFTHWHNFPYGNGLSDIFNYIMDIVVAVK